MANSQAPQPQWRGFAARCGVPGSDYAALWQWSVDHPARFWRAVWEQFDIQAHTGPGDGEGAVLADATMPGMICSAS